MLESHFLAAVGWTINVTVICHAAIYRIGGLDGAPKLQWVLMSFLVTEGRGLGNPFLVGQAQLATRQHVAPKSAT